MNRLVVSLLVLASASAAHADWPVFQHDAQRTGTTPGSALVSHPTARWKTYLGGSLGHKQFLSADVDGDGTDDLVFTSGGRVVAKRASGDQIWASPLVNAGDLVDLVDLDGDGHKDVVVRASDRVVLLRLETGQIEWESVNWQGTSFPVGFVGAVRIVDLDGDGAPDLFATANLCGSSEIVDGRLGTAWNFRSPGTLAKPQVLFDHTDVPHTERDYYCGQEDIVEDVDGDGVFDWIAFGTSHVYVHTTRAEPGRSLAAGALKTTSADIGSIPYAHVVADVADLDGDGKNDLVLYSNNPYQAAINSRRVMVVGWHLDTASAMTVFGAWWQQSVADLTSDQHGYAESGLRDLDGDGKLEVTTSFFSGATKRWSLHAFDAKSGTEKAMLDDSGKLVGLIALDNAGKVGVVCQREGGLRVYAFTAGAFVPLATYANTVAVTMTDRTRARRIRAAEVPFTAQVCGDSQNELLAYQTDANGSPIALVAVQPLTAATCATKYEVTSERMIGTYALGPNGLAVARSSGYMTTLHFAQGLVADNLTAGELSVPGVRIGGYYSGPYHHATFPLAVSTDAQTTLIANESHGNLVGFDAKKASLIKKPERKWSSPAVYGTSAFDVGGTPIPEVLGYRGADLVVLDLQTGADLKTYKVIDDTHAALNDILAARINGDTQADLVYTLQSTGIGTVEVHAMDSMTGTKLWSTPYSQSAAGCVAPDTALAPFTPGTPDVVVGDCSGLNVLDGATGVTRGAVTGASGGLMLSADVDGDGALDLVSSGAYSAVVATHADRTDIWRVTSWTATIAKSAAVVECPGVGMRYGGARYRDPVFFVLDAKTGAALNGTTGTVLAEGQVFGSTNDALIAGKRPGVLGNITGVTNLLGAGSNSPSFLVGSTDGYLYAFDACTGALRWSYDLGSPVGQPIFADVLRTGREQIVVSTADGYLQGIDDQILPAPTNARDVDSAQGTTQVSSIVTTDTLYLAWDGVMGAISYECAVIDPNDQIVTAGADFVPCGTTSPSTLSGLPLRNGVVYRQAVRAVAANGVSVEAVSPGVLVSLAVATDGGVDGGGTVVSDGCGCMIGRAGFGWSRGPAVFALVVIFLLLRRRRVD